MNISWKSAITIPNILSTTRIFMIPVISWLLVRDTLNSNLWAAILLMIAAVTDLLDGMLARMLNQQSELGKLLDPLADKLFAASFVIVLAIIRDFPLWFLILIIGKDVAIAMGGYIVMKRYDIVMQSKLVGKYAFASQVMLILSYYVRFPFGQWFFTITTLLLISATMSSYYYSFLRQVAGRSAEPNWSKQIKRFFLFIRLWLVFLGATVVLLHGYVWLFESPYSLKQKHSNPLVLVNDPELAMEYAPVLVIPETTLPPANAEAYFAEAQFSAGSRFFMGSFDEPVSSEEAVARTDAYIISSTPQTAARSLIHGYWQINDLPANELQVSRTVSYWFFFEKQNAPVYREGIWRAIILFLDESGDLKYAATTREWYVEIIPASQLKLLNGKPAVYLGQESHAFSFEPGELTQSLGPARILDINTDIAVDGRHFHAGVEYKLKELNQGYAWLNWRGLWGGPVPGGDLGPRWWHPKNANATVYERPLRLLQLFLNSDYH